MHRLPEQKRDQLLRTIHKAVRRMSGMMEEALVLGRLETDRMTFKPAAFDLGQFCQGWGHGMGERITEIFSKIEEVTTF